MRAARALHSAGAPPKTADSVRRSGAIHPEYDRGGSCHRLLYPHEADGPPREPTVLESIGFEAPPSLLDAAPSLMDVQQYQAHQRPPQQPTHQEALRKHRRLSEDEDDAPTRKAVLTPFAAKAAAAARERRARGTAGAPSTAPPPDDPQARRSSHPEYDPNNSHAASLLYPDRTPRQGYNRDRKEPAPARAAPPAAAALAEPTDAAPPASQRHGAPRGGPTEPAGSGGGGGRPTGNTQQEVIDGLRLQVASLSALLEQGVCVPLPVGGPEHDGPASAAQPSQQLLRVWFEARAPTKPAGWQWQVLNAPSGPGPGKPERIGPLRREF